MEFFGDLLHRKEQFFPTLFCIEKEDDFYSKNELSLSLLNDKKNSFSVEARDKSGSVRALVEIDKKNGKIISLLPQEEKDKIKIFKILFKKNMLSFSKKDGFLPLDLILCISMLYGTNDNLRIFSQDIYYPSGFDGVLEKDLDIYTNIYNSITNIKNGGVIVNIFGNIKNQEHINILLKINNDKFTIFDTKTPSSPVFYTFCNFVLRNLFIQEKLVDCGTKEIDILKLKKDCLLLNDKENYFQGPKSCFLMVLSFLEICKQNKDFVCKAEEYFKNEAGLFMILQQAMAFISDDKDILNLTIKKNIFTSNITISKIVTKFMTLNKDGMGVFDHDFNIRLNGTDKIIPLDCLVNIDTLFILLNKITRENKTSIDIYKQSPQTASLKEREKDKTKHDEEEIDKSETVLKKKREVSPRQLEEALRKATSDFIEPKKMLSVKDFLLVSQKS